MIMSHEQNRSDHQSMLDAWQYIAYTYWILAVLYGPRIVYLCYVKRRWYVQQISSAYHAATFTFCLFKM
jgi:hypothetical protein